VNRLNVWRFRWHLACTIQRRDLRATLYSFGPYVTLSAAIAIAATILRNYVKSVQDGGLDILSNPFAIPLFGAVVLSSIYLAIVSTTTIARERDQGTLEVLFYGPVDATAYLLGKYLAQASTCVLMNIVYLAVFWLYALVTNFAFDPGLFWAAILSVAIASAVVAVSILLSTLYRSVRGALSTLLAITLVFLGIQLGHDYAAKLTGQLARGQSNPLLLLQSILAWLDRILNWLSPFAYLERGMDALLRDNTGEYLLMLGLSLLYTAVAFGLAVWTLRRKGACG